MKRLPIIGIYSIRNMVNNKLYIGSSTYVQKRLVEHRRCLKNNIHTNQHLQHAWNLYGEEAFEFKLISNCHPRWLIHNEQYYMNLFQVCDDRYGYNIEPFAGAGRDRKGKNRNRSTSQKIALGHRGRVVSQKTRYKLSKLLRDNPQGIGKINKEKTHCPQGHPYNKENTKLDGGGRKCRICTNKKRLDRYHKNKVLKIKTHCPNGHEYSLDTVLPDRSISKRKCQVCLQLMRERKNARRRMREY